MNTNVLDVMKFSFDSRGIYILMQYVVHVPLILMVIFPFSTVRPIAAMLGYSLPC